MRTPEKTMRHNGLDGIGYNHIVFGSDRPTAGLDEQITALKRVVSENPHQSVLGQNVPQLSAAFGWWA